jgi:hypothetical protein
VEDLVWFVQQCNDIRDVTGEVSGWLLLASFLKLLTDLTMNIRASAFSTFRGLTMEFFL